MATLDTNIISVIISGIMLGIYKFFISKPSAKKQEEKILTKVDEKIKTEVCSGTPVTADVQLESAGVALERLRLERKKLESLQASVPRSTMSYDKAFYAVQRGVMMYDEVTRYCPISKMEYKKLIPKPKGLYTYFFEGHAIDYEIMHMTEIEYDDNDREVVRITPTFVIKSIQVLPTP